MEQEGTQDIVIVGAGISGLSTAVGLHRIGIRSTVLESWDDLKVTGFAFTTWFNAWKAMEALGVSQHIRNLHDRLEGYQTNTPYDYYHSYQSICTKAAYDAGGWWDPFLQEILPKR